MNDLPRPFTPVDCDLQDFPFMPLHVARLRDSDLAAEAHPEACWYAVLLWSASWHQLPAGSLPDNDRDLRALCGAGRRWNSRRAEALRGWIKCSDGRLYHPEVAKHVNTAWAARQALLRRIDRRLEICSLEWARLRSFVFAGDDYTCRYCRARGGALECDHVVPVAAGGPSVIENLVTACRPCNRSKGSLSLKEWAA